jgi:hypothetical protein
MNASHVDYKMGLLTRHELNVDRAMFLCTLDKLTKGLVDNPLKSKEVYKMIGIMGLGVSESETVDNLVKDAVLNGYIETGLDKEIMLTNKGLEWCKNICE